MRKLKNKHPVGSTIIAIKYDTGYTFNAIVISHNGRVVMSGDTDPFEVKIVFAERSAEKPNEGIVGTRIMEVIPIKELKEKVKYYAEEGWRHAGNNYVAIDERLSPEDIYEIFSDSLEKVKELVA